MIERRPAILLIAAGVLGLIGLALVVAVHPLMSELPVSPARTGGLALLVLAGGIVAMALLLVEPAWPLSLSLVAMAFSGNWDLVGSPVPLERVLVVIGLVSLAVRERRPAAASEGPPMIAYVLIALAATFAIVSAILSGTMGEREATFVMLDRYGLVPFVLFAVAPIAFRGEGSRRILLGCLTTLGGYLVYVSVLSRLGPESLVVPQFIVDPYVGIHADRARGPFLEAGANGMALFECGIAAAILASQPIGRYARLAAVVVVGGCALCIILTLTRAVWVGSIAGLIVAMLCARETRRLLVPAAVAGVLSVTFLLAVVPGLASDVSDRQSDDRPIWDRENSNAAALRMIEERPLVGFGWYTFAAENGNYQLLADDHIITRADLDEHNVFLSNAAELGLLGTLLWGSALAVAVGGALLRRGPPELRWWRVGFVAIAGQWFVIANFVPLSYALPNALLWLWAGILWTGSPAPKLQPPQQRIGASTT